MIITTKCAALWFVEVNYCPPHNVALFKLRLANEGKHNTEGMFWGSRLKPAAVFSPWKELFVFVWGGGGVNKVSFLLILSILCASNVWLLPEPGPYPSTVSGETRRGVKSKTDMALSNLKCPQNKEQLTSNPRCVRKWHLWDWARRPSGKKTHVSLQDIHSHDKANPLTSHL